MNSAGYDELARIPPTVAAATMTTSGFLFETQSFTSFWFLKSSSLRIGAKILQRSDSNLRMVALPTIPFAPATQTVLFFRSKGLVSNPSNSEDKLLAINPNHQANEEFEKQSFYLHHQFQMDYVPLTSFHNISYLRADNLLAQLFCSYQYRRA